VSLFLDAATLEELEWVIGRQINYYNCERRHSSLDYRSPMEHLISAGFIPETLVENGHTSGSVSGAQARTSYMWLEKKTVIQAGIIKEFSGHRTSLWSESTRRE